ncbi:hypothetical protein F5141DRAFT_1118875 [Pisolithus sp. B1]|nr:hypothetical protein F5141DRAFT_1118875 [Pisolithus sp. B1]
MDINYLGSRDEIQHDPIMPRTTTGIKVVATGPTKPGNRTFRANPSSVSQKKPRVNDYNDCEPKQCLYLGPDGTRCSQVITCTTVPEHFVSYGITNKSRDKVISCQWDGCSCGVMRHNFCPPCSREAPWTYEGICHPQLRKRTRILGFQHRINWSGDVPLIGTCVVYPLNC